MKTLLILPLILLCSCTATIAQVAPAIATAAIMGAVTINQQNEQTKQTEAIMQRRGVK